MVSTGPAGVYFARFGRVVKIGYSDNLAVRHSGVRGEARALFRASATPRYWLIVNAHPDLEVGIHCRFWSSRYFTEKPRSGESGWSEWFHWSEAMMVCLREHRAIPLVGGVSLALRQLKATYDALGLAVRSVEHPMAVRFNDSVLKQRSMGLRPGISRLA